MSRCGACDKKKGHWPWCPTDGARVHRGGWTPPERSYAGDSVQDHLMRIEEWAGVVNARLAKLEAPQAYPDGAPPGVVSPHVARNLAAIRAWCSPTFTWGDTRTALDKIDALIVVALAGGDVDPPPPTSGMIGTR